MFRELFLAEDPFDVFVQLSAAEVYSDLFLLVVVVGGRCVKPHARTHSRTHIHKHTVENETGLRGLFLNNL